MGVTVSGTKIVVERKRYVKEEMRSLLCRVGGTGVLLFEFVFKELGKVKGVVISQHPADLHVLELFCPCRVKPEL